MATMADLPTEISLDILKRLPTTALVCFKGVSKAWYNLASHPDITKLCKRCCLIVFSKDSPDRVHLIEGNYFHDKDSHSRFTTEIDLPFLPSECRITCLLSCNGLLLLGCLRELHGCSIQQVYIGNPLTKTFQALPEGQKVNYGYNIRYTYGFGFDSVTREYKVVRIVTIGGKQRFYVFTLGLTYWRRVDSGSFSATEGMNGVLFNGALKWVGLASMHPYSREVIISFDLCEEKFSSMWLPSNREGYHIKLAVLGGCLSAIGYCAQGMNIWYFKMNGGDGHWVKTCSIVAKFLTFDPFLRFPNGEIFFLGYYNAQCMRYDPETDSFPRHHWENLSNASHFTTFYPTLVDTELC